MFMPQEEEPQSASPQMLSVGKVWLLSLTSVCIDDCKEGCDYVCHKTVVPACTHAHGCNERCQLPIILRRLISAESGFRV